MRLASSPRSSFRCAIHDVGASFAGPMPLKEVDPVAMKSLKSQSQVSTQMIPLGVAPEWSKVQKSNGLVLTASICQAWC